jgi:hypothetical protein
MFFTSFSPFIALTCETALIEERFCRHLGIRKRETALISAAIAAKILAVIDLRGVL